jgi:serine/threonine-protein kinase RsbW
MELKISSDPRWLRLVRAMMQEVSRQAGFSEAERHQIALAVDEAISNVIKHSYKGEADRPVSVSCETENGLLEIVVRHRGERFEPRPVDHLPPDELRPGGRGLFLMRCVMDEVEFVRDGEENLVRLRKYLKEKPE